LVEQKKRPIAFATGPMQTTRDNDSILVGSAVAYGRDISTAAILLRLRTGDIAAGGKNKGGDSQSEQHQRAAGHLRRAP